jgi:hypothetical protein
MSLITRTAKGSKLTIAEMDGNLTTLNNQSFKDGVYSITSESRTDSITALASGSIEIKSIIPSTGEVIVEALEFLPTSFETDTIVAGTYVGVQPTGGSGTGLTVDVVVEDGDDVPEITSITVTAGGTGYQPDDVVQIATSELGAVSSTEETTVTLGSRDLSAEYQQRILMTPTGISMPDLPTEEPVVAGQLWNDANTLKISRGA